MKEFITGKKPEGYDFFEAIKKPVVVKFTQIEEDDFCIKDSEGNVQATGNKGDYLVLGNYESLHLLSKQEMENLFDLDVDENYKVKRYLMSKVNRDGAATLASQIDELMRSNWFTISKVAKKAKESEDEMQRKLFLLETFGFVETKQDDKEFTHYKVKLNDEDRERVIQRQKEYLQMQIDYLDQEQKLLSTSKDTKQEEDGGRTISLDTGEDK